MSTEFVLLALCQNNITKWTHNLCCCSIVALGLVFIYNSDKVPFMGLLAL